MKETLWSALRGARAVVVWKLESLGEYDLRRPMTPTGTNLLGLMKHLAGEEYGYFGEVFGRPAPEQLDCVADGSIWQNGDMWATPDESTEYIMGFHRRACAHADETIGALDLDAVGSVPWWKEGERETTLGSILVRMLSENERHAGHADIVRELIDGSAGGGRGGTGFPEGANEMWWQEYVARLEAAALTAAAGQAEVR
jgi:Protein of unknown function (DUF664)